MSSPTPHTQTPIDCAVIGAGPAGMAAAVHAVRRGLKTVLFEANKPGGQALAANWIEDYPGFPEGLTGPDLMTRFYAQVEAHTTSIQRERVTAIESGAEGFRIRTTSSETNARTVILATGLVPKQLGVPGEHSLIDRRIFAYADPRSIPHAGKRVLIVGSGDAAFDQALNYARQAAHVSIAIRGTTPRCNATLARRVSETAIDVIRHCHIQAISEVDGNLTMACRHGEMEMLIEADLLVTCIGKTSDISCLSPELRHRNTPGLFCAGDCQRGKSRHIAIAVGDGTTAAIAASDFLRTNHCFTEGNRN